MPAFSRRVMLLEAAFRDALDLLAANGVATSNIELTTINAAALASVDREWAPSPARRVRWDWRAVVAHHRQHARRPALEVAIWSDGVLCGLMIGPTSRRASRVYVEGIEGAPLGHPLKGRLLAICIVVAEAYARQIGAHAVWVWEPDPLVIPKYKVLGYTEVLRRVFFGRQSRFCIKKLNAENQDLP